jgi:hypothetical protein
MLQKMIINEEIVGKKDIIALHLLRQHFIVAASETKDHCCWLLGEIARMSRK